MVVVVVVVEVSVRRGRVVGGRLVVFRTVEVLVSVGTVPPMILVVVLVTRRVTVVDFVTGLESRRVLVKKHAKR